MKLKAKELEVEDLNETVDRLSSEKQELQQELAESRESGDSNLRGTSPGQDEGKVDVATFEELR